MRRSPASASKMGPLRYGRPCRQRYRLAPRKARGIKAAVADATCEAGWLRPEDRRVATISIRRARAPGQRDPEVEALIVRLSAEKGVDAPTFLPDEILGAASRPDGE